MKVLGIDTSSLMGSVALIDDDVLITEQLLNIGVTHSERLIPSINGILNVVGMEAGGVDGFAVAIGPGSFTGLRIGLGAAKGLAFATDKPIVGVSSLVAIAYNLFGVEIPIVSLIDARRGELYISVNRFADGRLISILRDTIMPPGDIVNYILSLDRRVVFAGDGVYVLKGMICERLGDKAVIPPPGVVHPRASNVAWLGLPRIQAGDVDDLAAIKPNYIRRSDAESGQREA